MPNQVPQSAFATRVACILFAVLSVIALAYPPLPILTLLGDSAQYQEAAERIFSPSLFDIDDTTGDRPHIATSLRPPLFPLLLALASRLPGLTHSDSLVALHIILGAVLVGATPLILTRHFQPLLVVVATGFSIYSAKQVAWGVMSEWLAMVFLFLSCVSYLSWISHTSARRAFVTSLCASLAVLTRAAALPWLLLLPCMVMQAPRGTRRNTVAALAGGLVPLLIWGAINIHRTGSFSLVPYEGLNLLATARSLGPIPLNPDDTGPQRHLITTLNEHGREVSDTALTAHEVHRWEGEFYDAFHANFTNTTRAIESYGTTTALRPGDISARALRAHAERYQRFLRGGVYTLVTEYAPLILACMVTATWLALRAPQYARWGLGVVTLCVIAIAYLTIIFGSMLWLPRYFTPVKPILLFCLVTSTSLLIRALARRAPVRGNSGMQ